MEISQQKRGRPEGSGISSKCRMGKICRQEYSIQQDIIQNNIKGDSLSAKERLKVTKTRKDQRTALETMTKQVIKWQ